MNENEGVILNIEQLAEECNIPVDEVLISLINEGLMDAYGRLTEKAHDSNIKDYRARVKDLPVIVSMETICKISNCFYNVMVAINGNETSKAFNEANKGFNIAWNAHASMRDPDAIMNAIKNMEGS